MTSLHDRANLMLDHCNRTGVEISAYWRGYIENVLLELDLLADDHFSDRYYFARTFDGGTFGLGKGSPALDKLSRIVSSLSWKPFSQRFPWSLRGASVYRHLFRPFFALSVALRRQQERNASAQRLYARAVRHTYQLIADDVADAGLKPRRRRNSDDIDIFESESGSDVYFSLNSMQRFKVLQYLRGLVDFDDKIVVEIGSGVGEMARICISLGIVRRYILVDIPPALAFSESYMIEEFGTDAVDAFDPNRTVVDFSDGKRVTVLTPDQIQLISQADIAINQASFGEMAPDIVERYVEQLKGAGIADFISINHRTEKPNNEESVGMEDYVRFFSPELVPTVSKSFDWGLLLPIFSDDEPGIPGYQLLHFQR
jgi:putative sugar O-methyltransferase